jgi:hypothetical protein
MLNSIPPGEERVITLTLNGESVGSFTLLATVSADNDPITSNNTTQGTITIVSPPPPITTPAPSSTLTSTSVTFTGGHTNQDTEHWLSIGSGTHLWDNLIFHQPLGTEHTRTVSGLPTSGTLYVRWWSKNSSGSSWQFQDHTYTISVGEN